MTVGLIVYVITGALFVALGTPLMRRRIRPNGLYGLRVRETLDDEQVWYEANARSGRDMVVVGVIGFAMSIALYLAPNVDEETYHLIMGGFLLASVILTYVWDVRFAKRLAAERQGEDE